MGETWASVFTVSLGVIIGLAVIAYVAANFYLYRLGHYSRSDIIILAFLLWTVSINVMMGGSFVFFGGASGSIPIISDLWKDYSKVDKRFATQDPMLMALAALSLFFNGPIAAFLIYCIIFGHELRVVIQPLLAGVLMTRELLLVLSEIFSDLGDLNFDPVLIVILFLTNIPFFMCPILMIQQSVYVAMGGSYTQDDDDDENQGKKQVQNKQKKTKLKEK